MTAVQRKATMMGVAPAANANAPAPARAPAPSSPTLDTDDTQQFMQTPKAPPVGEETPKAPHATMADAFLGDSWAAAPEPKKPAASPMFPTSNEPPAQVNEPTMMKQAAELLEEALREAGGSMEEIGANPLFAQATKDKETPKDVAKEAEKRADAPLDQSGDTVVMSKSAGASTPPPPVATAKTERQQAPTPVAPAVAARSVPPPSAAQPPAQPIGASIRQPEKKSPTGMILGLLAVVVLVGAGVFVIKSMSTGNGGGDKPTPPTSVPTATTTTLTTFMRMPARAISGTLM
jgi:hypothetical protein